MRNEHRMFITYIYRTLDSRNTKNTNNFLVQVRNFLLLLTLKVFRHKQRDTIFLCWLFHLPPTNTCGVWHKATVSKRKSTVSSRARNSADWLFQNPLNPPQALPVYYVIDIWSNFLSGIFILTSLNDTSSPCTHQHLRSCLHLTNPCTKKKVLSLTKPKGRIYKTKSLGHYITHVLSVLLEWFGGWEIGHCTSAVL